MSCTNPGAAIPLPLALPSACRDRQLRSASASIHRSCGNSALNAWRCAALEQEGEALGYLCRAEQRKKTVCGEHDPADILTEAVFRETLARQIKFLGCHIVQSVCDP